MVKISCTIVLLLFFLACDIYLRLEIINLQATFMMMTFEFFFKKLYLQHISRLYPYSQLTI